MLVVFFKRSNDEFTYVDNHDVHGKTVCRPDGYYTFDLDQDGRNWLSQDRITLVQPASVNECFRMLTEGEIDLVALNEFTGRAAMADLGLEDEVAALQNPIALQGLHAVVHKTHRRATILMHAVNDGIRRLEDAGTLDEIIAEHLARFYDDLS